MRLTIINQFYAPDISPTAQLSSSLAEDRAAAGDRVTVITGSGGYVSVGGGVSGREARANPRVLRAWTPNLGKRTLAGRLADYLSFYFWAVLHVLRLPAQDVIVSLTTPPYIALAGYLHCLLHRRTKLVLWNMDCYPEAAEQAGVIREGGVVSRGLRWLNRRIFKRLDHLVCLDGAMAQLLVSRYGPRGRNLPSTIIPNWERASLFPAEATPGKWQGIDELGLARRFVVLYLGNAGVGHEFETVLRTAERLRDQPVTFLFIGGGSRWKGLEEEAARLGLIASKTVILRGYVPKERTPAVMAACQCALITLRPEALGVMSPSKLHANLAAGLPVIYVGPAGSNVDEAISRFGCGISVRQGDVEAVLGFVRRAMTDEQWMRDLRHRSRAAFEQGYCDARTLPMFARVLEEVSARG
jgi:glycosyltransferase involved in cell wall biosynthesis